MSGKVGGHVFVCLWYWICLFLRFWCLILELFRHYGAFFISFWLLFMFVYSFKTLYSVCDLLSTNLGLDNIHFFLLLTESVFSHSENLLIQEKYVISEFNIRCMFIFGSLECFLIWTWIDRFFDFWNVTFINISAISWRPVLVVEEARVPGENQRPCASNWQAFSLASASRVHLFCNLQSQVRAHTVLVIGLYELLGNPTT